MLFGHGWVDETRPHNLLADWSQEEKKATCLQRNGWKRQPTTEIFTYKLQLRHISVQWPTLCDGTWGHRDAGKSYMSMQMFVSSSVLHAFCILLNQGASVCRQIFNACVKTMRNFTRLHLWCRISHSHMQTHTWHIHTNTHTHAFTHRNTFPLFITPEKN